MWCSHPHVRYTLLFSDYLLVCTHALWGVSLPRALGTRGQTPTPTARHTRCPVDWRTAPDGRTAAGVPMWQGSNVSCANVNRRAPQVTWSNSASGGANVLHCCFVIPTAENAHCLPPTPKKCLATPALVYCTALLRYARITAEVCCILR
jgi:hypothetical protein